MTEPKLAKNMSPAEYAAKLAELRRGPPMAPQPLLPEKHARDLSEQERAEWLSNYKRSLQ
jgi:ribosomal protein L29